MAYSPVSRTVPQYSIDGDSLASGYYLKGYEAGTTTPLSMATDSTGGTTLAKCKLNTAGYPLSNDSDDTSVFIPHFNAASKLALYTNATDADADTTANAVWVVDAIQPYLQLSSGYTFSNGGTERTLQSRLEDRISLDDFGVVGDGVTDDGPAIKSAFDAAVSLGGARVLVPAGDYLITTLDFSTTDDETHNVQFEGEGGASGQGASRFIFKPSSSGQKGLTLTSTVNFRFSDIEFIAGNSNMSNVIEVTAFDIPVISNSRLTFERCSWRAFSGESVTESLVHIKNCELTRFIGCQWTGNQPSIRIGENAGVDSGTYANGGAGDTIFDTCIIAGDITFRKGTNLEFRNVEFLRKSDTGEPCLITPQGDQSLRNVTFINCQNTSVNTPETGTFFTQGASGSGLVVIGCRLENYATIFNINGDGNVFAAGNWFDSDFSGTVFTIGAASNRKIEIANNDYDAHIGNGYTPIDDNRTTPRWPLIVDSDLAADHTFATVGSFEDIITASGIELTGGALRIRWSATVTSAASVAYTGRVTIDGTTVQGVSAQKTITSGETHTMGGEQLIRKDAIPAGASIVLQMQQASGTASVVEATDTNFATMLQVEEV